VPALLLPHSKTVIEQRGNTRLKALFKGAKATIQLVLQCRGRERLQSTGCLLQQNGSGPGNSCAMHQDSNNNKMAIVGVQQSIAMATINRLSAMAEW